MSKRLFIESFSEGSQVLSFGAEEGEVILSVNGLDITNNSSFSSALSAASDEKKIIVYKPNTNRSAQYTISSGKLGISTVENEAHPELELQISKQITRLKQRLSLIPMFTTEQCSPIAVKETIGLVRGSTVQSKHIGKDVLASFKSIVGGELKAYTELLDEAREEALFRMSEDAKSLGASAITGVRLDSAEITEMGAEVIAYGTAVKL